MWSKEEQDNFVNIITEFKPELSEEQKKLLLEYALYVVFENDGLSS